MACAPDDAAIGLANAMLRRAEETDGADGLGGLPMLVALLHSDSPAAVTAATSSRA